MIGRGMAPIGVHLEADALEELSAIERALVASFGAARRKAEFVAGRRAARAALLALGVVPDAISRADDGAPVVHATTAVVLSISHGERMAFAAATHTGPLGIDLTDRRDAARIRRVARRAFPREAERALALVDDESACRAWAIKEAVAKALRIGMLEQSGVERIEILDLATLQLRVDGAPPALSLSIEDVEDGVLAIAGPIRRP
ncbi:MAG: 4'-phosphopantetheinyl transferase superfamily protein [Myxococcales bacterium]|nr:4'-phosphopantetheinyl transferase superfamily protein [Myxococcales bacterium]